MTTGGGPDDLDHAAAVFGEVRPRVFGIAYRMLGSVAEAEDLVPAGEAILGEIPNTDWGGQAGSYPASSS